MFFLLPCIAGGVVFVLAWSGGLLSRPGLVGAAGVGGIVLQNGVDA